MCGEEWLVEQEMDWVASDTAPESFDARTKWPGKLAPVTNQQQCGGCWAFATVTAAYARFQIQGKKVPVLSPQDLISCDTTNNGCSGGNAARAQTSMTRTGTSSLECLPFVSGSGRVPTCPKTCQNGSAIVRYKYASTISYTAAKVMDGIVKSGPVYLRFNVYEDFYNYKSGVYIHKTGQDLGGHAVTLMGWGTEGGVKYWLCQNSWGPAWGESGFFKIRRGANECGCEQSGFYSGLV